MLTYFIKVNVALVVFWIVYRLCFGRDTLFPLRRATLWAMALFALAYPLIVITVRVAAGAEVPMADDLGDIAALGAVAATAAVPEKAAAFPLWMIPVGAYLLGAAILFGRFLVQLARIVALGFRSDKSKVCGTVVRLTAHPSAPFSFFGWIFADPARYTKEELCEIITHERTHVRELHSVDMVFFELLKIVFWPNPFAWLMKASVHQNLEYLADKDVIRSGSDRRQYQYRLLQLSCQMPLSGLANHFSKSQLKNRIAMMNKRQTPRRGFIKYVFALPLVFSLLVLSNVRTVAVAADRDVQAAEKPETVIVIGTVGRYIADNPDKALPVSSKSVKTIHTGKMIDADTERVIVRERATTHPGTATELVIANDILPDNIKQALIILDDVEISMEKMKELDPALIASITVLKDASAKELYGLKGANGVIVITTKGKAKESDSPVTAIERVVVRRTVTAPLGTATEGVTFNDVINLKKPLIILDDLEISKEKMIDLDPAVIESITVLKDASAKGLYGSKGANGVVVITTNGKAKESDAK